jgi:hypothetical protein
MRGAPPSPVRRRHAPLATRRSCEARRKGRDPEREPELALAYERAKALAAPDALEIGIRATFDAYIEALGVYDSFMKAHCEELLEETRTEANEVAAEYQRAHEKARRILDPVEEKHRHLHFCVSLLTGYQQKIRRSRVPEGWAAFDPSHWETLELLTVPADQFGTPPIPSPEAMAEYAAHVHPRPPEPLEPATDQDA